MAKQASVISGNGWGLPAGVADESILSHEPPHSISNWLEHAVDLEIYRSQSVSFQTLVNNLFTKISQRISITSPARYKEALKLVLVNLWKSRVMDAPVKYSRDRNRYIRDRRYGQLFLKYDRLKAYIRNNDD